MCNGENGYPKKPQAACTKELGCTTEVALGGCTTPGRDGSTIKSQNGVASAVGEARTVGTGITS